MKASVLDLRVMLAFWILAFAAAAQAAPPFVPMPPLAPPGNQPAPFPPGFPGQGGLHLPGITVPSHLMDRQSMEPNERGISAIRGVVMDAEHDQPIPDARVVLLRVTEQRDQQVIRPWISVDADAHGAFAFESLPSGTYLIEACHFGATMVPWDFADEEERLIVVEAGEEKEDARVFIYGGHQIRVLTSGVDDLGSPGASRFQGLTLWPILPSVARQYILSPSERLSLGGSSRSGMGTLEGNTFIFNGVFGREVRVDINASTHWVQGEQGERLDSIALQLDPDQLVVELELELHPPVTLSGRVVNENGEPIGPGSLEWNPAGRVFFASGLQENDVPIDADGTFNIEIPGRMDGFLDFELPGRNPIRYGIIGLKESVPDLLKVEIPSGNELLVKVVGPDGEPATGAMATLQIGDMISSHMISSNRDLATSPARLWFLPEQPEDDETQQARPFGRQLLLTFTASADEDGIARFEGLSEGLYSLRVVGAPGSRHAPKSIQNVTVVSDGDNEVTVNLEWFQPFGGVVLDSEGNPLPGARVVLGFQRDPQNPAPDMITDHEGKFRFEDVAPENLQQIQLRPPDNPNTSYTVGSWLPGTLDAVLQVGRSSHVVTIRVKALDSRTDELLRNAVITTWEGDPLPNQVINDAGEVELTLMSSGRMWGTVKAEGYAPMPLDLSARYGSFTEIRLPPEQTIHGRVIDIESEEPLSGVLVEYLRLRELPIRKSPDIGPLFSTHTDDEGRFELAGVPILERRSPLLRQSSAAHFDFALEVKGGSHYAFHRYDVSVEETGDVEMGDIAIGAGRTLQVRVVQDEKPIVNTPVNLIVQFPSTMYPGISRDHGIVLTNEEGIADFSRIPIGQMTAILDEYGFHRSLGSFEYMEPIDFALGSNSLTFDVRNQSGPVSTSFSVTGPDNIAFSSGRTGAGLSASDGVYRVDNLVAGSWRFEFSSRTRQVVTVEVGEGSPRDAISVPYGRHDLTIRVDGISESDSVRFDWVELTPQSESIPGVTHHFRASWSQRDSAVNFRAIPPGDYMVRMTTNNRPLQWVHELVTVNETDVDQQVTLPFSNDGGDIVVRASDVATGLPLGKWRAYAYLAGRSGYVADPIEVGPGESARFESIPPGLIRIQASATHYLRNDMELELKAGGTHEIELMLEPAGTLLVTLNDEAGRGEARRRQGGYTPHVQIKPLAESNPGEDPSILYLPPPQQQTRRNSIVLRPGRYEARVIDNQREVHREEVMIRLGETTTVDVTLKGNDN